MLSQLWSNALADPLLAFAFVLIALVVIGVIGVFIQIVLEGRKAGVTTAAELRKDAQTAERRKALRKMQRRFGARRAS